MRLKSMSMAGFKSFADRTTFKLAGQIIAVVGPNGCGKSNIVDAVRWVMGESRASQMRQETSYDMIFNGSGKRKASDLCSVELHLINNGTRDLGMWNEYAEISIRRSLERDGDSGYFINGQRVRRRDVVDFFAGSGIGARSYGVVEQEQITRIVQAEPKRIRAHLEEAAGVATYKERRRETQRRIETAQTNVARLEDITGELTRQMDALARQAKQTVRVRKQKQELDLLHRYEMQLRTEELAQAGDSARERMEQLAVQVTSARDKVTEQEKEISSARNERQKQNERLGDLQAKHYGCQSKFEQLRGSEREFDLRLEQEQAQLNQARQSITDLDDTCTELEESVAQLVTRVEKLVVEVAGKEQESERLRLGFEQAQATETGKAQAAAGAAEQLANHTGELQQAQASTDLAAQRFADLEANLAGVHKELDSLAPVAEIDQGQLDAVKQAAAQAAAKALANEQQRQSLNDDLMTAKEDLLRLQGRLGGLNAEHELLLGLSGKAKERHARYEQWLADHGVATAQRFTDAAGLQAPGVEAAVDTVLDRCLDGYAVTDYQELAVHAQQPKGLVMLEPAQGKAGSGARQQVGLPLLQTKVTAKPEWKDFIASLLHGCYLAPDMAAAWAALPHLEAGETIVTAAGQLLRPGLLATPRSKEMGVAWTTRRNKIDQEVAECKQLISKTEQQLALLTSDHDQCRDNGTQLAQQRRDADEKLAATHAEQLRLEHANEFLLKQERRLQDEIKRLAADCASRADAVKEAQMKLEKVSGTFDQAQQLVSAAKQDQEQAVTKAEEARVTHGTLERELRDLRLTISHEQQREQELHSRLAAQQNLLQEMREHSNQLQQRVGGMSKRDLEKQIKHAQAEESKASAALSAAQDEASQLRIRETELEHRLLDNRAALEQLAAQHRELELDATSKTAEAKVARIQLEDLGGALEELETQELCQSYPTQEAVREWMEKLRRRIEQAGPINYAADAEHGECETRMVENSTQIADLQNALVSLKAAIDRIDTEMLDRLRKVFNEVNERFGKLFSMLFDGGNAALELVGDNLLADGITLKANPPGKRVSTITALSGGEKTLTALAFLFALNELNPPPFCILDEVDAALDEANTHRFVKLIDSMRNDVQFVLITHNKSVLEYVDHLVGVTQEEKGVSKLVAVRVDEAVANAQAAGGI